VYEFSQDYQSLFALRAKYMIVTVYCVQGVFGWKCGPHGNAGKRWSF